MLLRPLVIAALVFPIAWGQFGELEEVALEELRETNTPGSAAAAVRGDRIVFAKGFGVASAEGGAPVTADTLFRLGSTTKMMTAAILVALAETVAMTYPFSHSGKGHGSDDASPARAGRREAGAADERG